MILAGQDSENAVPVKVGDPMFNFAMLDESLQVAEVQASTPSTNDSLDGLELESMEEELSEEMDTWEGVCHAVGAHVDELTDMISSQHGEDYLNGVNVFRNNPGQNVLSSWTHHEKANNILKQFTLQGLGAKTNIMTMADARQLFEAAGLSAKWVVSKFKTIEHERDTDAIMNQIICRFSSETIQGKRLAGNVHRYGKLFLASGCENLVTTDHCVSPCYKPIRTPCMKLGSLSEAPNSTLEGKENNMSH